MATTPLTPIVSAFDLTVNWQDLFEVPTNVINLGIDAAVFNNYSAGSTEFSVRLVQSGTATNLNEIITNEPIRAGGNDLAPSMIGQALVSGGVIQAKANANNSVSVVNITATLITR